MGVHDVSPDNSLTFPDIQQAAVAQPLEPEPEDEDELELWPSDRGHHQSAPSSSQVDISGPSKVGISGAPVVGIGGPPSVGIGIGGPLPPSENLLAMLPSRDDFEDESGLFLQGEISSGSSDSRRQRNVAPPLSPADANDLSGTGATLDSECPGKEPNPNDPEAKFLRSRSRSLGRLRLLMPLRRYAKLINRYPVRVLATYIVVLILVIVIGWRPMALETDFSAFVRADGEGLRKRDAFTLALGEQKEPGERRLQSSVGGAEPDSGPILGREPGPRRLAIKRQRFTNWLKRELTIMYKPKNGNALDERVLREIRDFEVKLRNLRGWQHFCKERAFWADWVWLCDPGESILPFAWPSRGKPNASLASSSSHLFELKFDTLGRDLLPFPAMFKYMLNSYKKGKGDPTRDPSRFFPKEFDATEYLNAKGKGVNPGAVKTRFTFFVGFAEKGWTLAQTKAELAATDSELETFIHQEVYGRLLDFPGVHSEIYYLGHYIDDHEVSLTLFNDIYFSIGSILFVTLYMWIHMKSVVISLACFCIVFGSVPVAYVLCPAERTTLASFSSVFLITVIDIDVIFVFVGFWVQSKHLKRMEERIVWMMAHAGKSCLATSVTTSVSFFANLASSLQPLREFGLFMGLCVMSVYVLAIFMLPPIMVLEERRLRKRLDKSVFTDSGSASSFSIVPSETLAVEDRAVVVCSDGGETPAEAFLDAKKTPGKTRLFIFLFNMVEFISRRAIPLVVITVLVWPGLIYGIVSRVKMDTGIPELFPKAHNQVEGKRLHKEFDGVGSLNGMKAPLSGAAACNASDFSPVDPNSKIPCIFQWCDSMPIYPPAKASSEEDAEPNGTCTRGPTFIVGEQLDVGHDISSCKEIYVKNRYAAPGPVAEQDWAKIWTNVMREITNTTQASYAFGSTTGYKNLDTLTLEDWGTGTVQTSNFFERTPVKASLTASFDNSSRRIKTCVIETMCFFGTPMCDVRRWKPMRTKLTPPVFPKARLLATRSLAGLTEVHVLWGLRAPLSSPVVGSPAWQWELDPTFEPENPWAQRAMNAICTEHPKTLYVRSRICWIELFKKWLRKGESFDGSKRFPSRNFNKDILLFYRKGAVADNVKKQLWFVDSKLVACQVQLWVNLNKGIPSASVLRYKTQWDEFLTSVNGAASLTANRAWHTSHVWVTAEAELAIVSSTMNTILIEIGIGWLCILVFTGDPVLALIVLGLVVINISGLAFFMIVLMDWSIGPIEVICLVIFVGYSVTFGLHVAHNYAEVSISNPTLVENHALAKKLKTMGRKAWDADSLQDVEKSVAKSMRDAKIKAVEPTGAKMQGVLETEGDKIDVNMLSKKELRIGRTRIAVLHVGGAILSAAVSTVGSSIFLLLCTLTIFNKIGAVVITVTILSVIVTLVSLPAALILFGPGFDPCYKRIPRKVWNKLTGHR